MPKLAKFLVILGTISIAESKWVGIDNPCLCQEFRCAEGGACLHKSRVCNGYRDCPGGEDETGYEPDACKTRKKTMCDASKEFKCKFGGCILLGQVCDGKIDCYGGVDEATDFCGWVHGDDNSTTVKTT